MAGSGGSLLRLDVVRDEEAVEKEICFRKCRCGSQANPLWNYFVPPGGVGLAVRGVAAACWENSSATARIIRKINYFPSLLINFTIASMFLLLAGYYRSLSSDVQWKENSAWKRRRRNKDGTEEGKRSESFHGCLGLLVSCIRVSGCSQFEYLSSLFFFYRWTLRDQETLPKLESLCSMYVQRGVSKTYPPTWIFFVAIILLVYSALFLILFLLVLCW